MNLNMAARPHTMQYFKCERLSHCTHSTSESQDCQSVRVRCLCSLCLSVRVCVCLSPTQARSRTDTRNPLSRRMTNPLSHPIIWSRPRSQGHGPSFGASDIFSCFVGFVSNLHVKVLSFPHFETEVVSL